MKKPQNSSLGSCIATASVRIISQLITTSMKGAFSSSSVGQIKQNSARMDWVRSHSTFLIPRRIIITVVISLSLCVCLSACLFMSVSLSFCVQVCDCSCGYLFSYLLISLSLHLHVSLSLSRPLFYFLTSRPLVPYPLYFSYPNLFYLFPLHFLSLVSNPPFSLSLSPPSLFLLSARGTCCHSSKWPSTSSSSMATMNLAGLVRSIESAKLIDIGPRSFRFLFFNGEFQPRPPSGI